MHDASPSNDAIAHCFRQMGPELTRRYGLEGGCTRAQVLKTATDLKIAAEVVPYLYSAFVADDEFRAYVSANAGHDWEEVDRRAQRIFNELLRTNSPPEGDGFRESWKGVNGV